MNISYFLLFFEMTNDLKTMTKIVRMNVSQGCHKVDYFTVKLYLKKEQRLFTKFQQNTKPFYKIKFHEVTLFDL